MNSNRIRLIALLALLLLASNQGIAGTPGSTVMIPMPALGTMSFNSQPVEYGLFYPNDYNPAQLTGLYFYIEGGAGNNNVSKPRSLTDASGWVVVAAPQRNGGNPYAGYLKAIYDDVVARVPNLHPDWRVICGHSAGCQILSAAMRDEGALITPDFNAFMPGGNPSRFNQYPLDPVLYRDKFILHWTASRDFARNDVHGENAYATTQWQAFLSQVEYMEYQTYPHNVPAPDNGSYPSPINTSQYGAVRYNWFEQIKKRWPSDLPRAQVKIWGKGFLIPNGRIFDPIQLDGTDFGQVPLSTFRDQVFEVRNPGNAAMNVVGVQFYNGIGDPDDPGSNLSPGSAQFSVLTGFPVAVPAGGSANITVRYSPGPSAGPHTARFEILNTATVPYAFNIRGRGAAAATGPEIEVSGGPGGIAGMDPTAPIHFPPLLESGAVVPTASSTVDKTFTIHNIGTAALTGIVLSIGEDIVFPGQSGAFSVIQAPPSTVAAGASATFVVRIDLGSFTTRGAVLSLTSNDANESNFSFRVLGVRTITPATPTLAPSFTATQSSTPYAGTPTNTPSRTPTPPFSPTFSPSPTAVPASADLVIDDFNNDAQYNTNNLNDLGQWADDDDSLISDTVAGGVLSLVEGSGGYWYTGFSSSSFNASSYSAIRFDVKGSTGGETFNINVQDKPGGGAKQNHIFAVTSFVNVTTGWQTVEISFALLSVDPANLFAFALQSFAPGSSIQIDNIAFVAPPATTPTHSPTAGLPSATVTPANSATLSSTTTPVDTLTFSATPSPIETKTATPTTTFNWTATSTPTHTPYAGTPTSTETFSETSTTTSTLTVSPSPTATWTLTVTSSTTPTSTPTCTATVTGTVTASSVSTATSTRTSTTMPTSVQTATATLTPVVVSTVTATATVEAFIGSDTATLPGEEVGPSLRAAIAIPNPNPHSLFLELGRSIDGVQVTVYTSAYTKVGEFETGTLGRGNQTVPFPVAFFDGLNRGIYYGRVKLKIMGETEGNGLTFKLLLLK